MSLVSLLMFDCVLFSSFTCHCNVSCVHLHSLTSVWLGAQRQERCCLLWALSQCHQQTFSPKQPRRCFRLITSISINPNFSLDILYCHQQISLPLTHTLTDTHSFLFSFDTLTDSEIFSCISRLVRWSHRGVIVSVNTALWSVFMAEVGTSQLQEVHMFREVVTIS